MMILPRISSTISRNSVEIVPNVYQLTIKGVNLILIGEEELTIIDTGLPGTSAEIVDFIHSRGRSVEEISLIIITHNHFDHAGGLSELRKLTTAKVAVHKADIGDIENQPSYPRVIQRALRVPPFSALRSAFSVRANTADIQLVGGEVLRPLGGLKVIHTPGHTPGSISLFSPQNRLLIVGDALNKIGKTLRLPYRMVSTDLAQAIDSIREIARLDFDILCFGHAPPLTDDVRTKMQELLEKIKGSVPRHGIHSKGLTRRILHPA